jgi:beta-aspartyl-peptidase (threonine type)
MRTTVLAPVLLALAACASTAPERDVVTPMNASARVSPEERASGEILAVLRSQSAAWNRGEIEAYMDAGYWHSPELTFYSGGSVTKGYEAVLARYIKRYKSEGTQMGHLEFSQIETELLGPDSALARGHWALTFPEKTPLGGLFTLVLRRLPQGWRIVHDHSSVETP